MQQCLQMRHYIVSSDSNQVCATWRKKRWENIAKATGVDHQQSPVRAETLHNHGHYPAWCSVSERATCQREYIKWRQKGRRSESKEWSGSSRINEEEKRWKRRTEEEFSGGQFYRLHSSGAFHTVKGHHALTFPFSALRQSSAKLTRHEGVEGSGERED